MNAHISESRYGAPDSATRPARVPAGPPAKPVEEDVIQELRCGGGELAGFSFLTDEKGRKTAAVIDLKVHKALWEDIQDVLVSKARRHEKGVSLDKVKAGLIASGKLRG